MPVDIKSSSIDTRLNAKTLDFRVIILAHVVRLVLVSFYTKIIITLYLKILTNGSIVFFSRFVFKKKFYFFPCFYLS